MEKVLPQQGTVFPTFGEDSGPEWLFLETSSPSMRTVEAVIRELAHSSVPVLLVGERGTGKRTVARRIHQDAGWGKGQFCSKDCRGLLPGDLIPGSQEGGTLYLDEIGDLSGECQDQLLKHLAQEFHNGSGCKPLRVIAGSSRDLESEVRAGSLREDLYYRLSGVCLRIPPLRQRREDISGLISFFLKWYSEAFHRPVPTLSVSTERLFLEHSWPGNMTELAAAARAIVAVGNESVAMGGLRSMLTRNGEHTNGEKTSLKDAARAASREAEKEMILKVLTRTRWNRRRAAQELQISYKALLYKLKQIGYGDYGTS